MHQDGFTRDKGTKAGRRRQALIEGGGGLHQLSVLFSVSGNLTLLRKVNGICELKSVGIHKSDGHERSWNRPGFVERPFTLPASARTLLA